MAWERLQWGLNIAGSLCGELLERTGLRRPEPLAGAPPEVQELEAGPEDSLLRQARLVARGIPPITAGHYWWLNETEVLLMRLAANQHTFELVQLNIATGAARTPVDFNEKWRERLEGRRFHVMAMGQWGVDRQISPPTCDLSTDGRRLLWTDERGQWLAATLDGVQHAEWPGHGPYSSGHWLPGADAWVEFEQVVRKNRFFVDAVHLHELEPRRTTTFKVDRLPGGVVIGCHPPEHLVQYYLADEANGEYQLAEIGVASSGVSVRQFDPRQPSEDQMMEMALSPDGGRLAWVTGEFDGVSPPLYQLWVTGLCGENAHELGAIRARVTRPPGTRRDRYHWPQMLRWLPDATRVSFVMLGCLYTVEIPALT